MPPDFSVAALDELEPGNYFPLAVGSEDLRKVATFGIVQSWGMRRPFYIRQNGILSVMCGRAKDVRDVFQDARRFTVIAPKRPGYHVFDMFGGMESVLQMDGARHERVRKLMNPSFVPASVEAMRADVEAIIAERLDRIAEKAPAFDGMADFCQGLVERVLLQASFKFSDEQRDVFLRMLEQMYHLSSFDPNAPPPEGFLKSIGEVRQVIDQIIDERRKKPGTDLISSLIAANEDGDKLTDAELFGQINSIATAGIGTTSNVLAGALWLLARHPAQKQLLISNPALLDSAIEECLRYHSSGLVAFVRFATCDTDVGGTRILKDMPVYVSPQAAGFDPGEVEDPFRFDITRTRRTPLVFGGGIHHCIGQRLARHILRVALSSMITRFPDFRLADRAFFPNYRGLPGEMSPTTLPMRTE
jgi:cytochrome P450